MQAMHTSMAVITASKVCTRCKFPHHRSTFTPLETSNRTVRKLRQKREGAYISSLDRCGKRHTTNKLLLVDQQGKP